MLDVDNMGVSILSRWPVVITFCLMKMFVPKWGGDILALGVTLVPG